MYLLKYKNQNIIFSPLTAPQNVHIHDCKNLINEERRNQLHEEFWSLEYNLRKMWISRHVEQYPVKRRRKSQSIKVRSNSRSYKLHSDNSAVQVCKNFFLSTLGFASDQVITTSLKSPTFKEDERGRHVPSHKLKDSVVEAIKMSHILLPSFCQSL